MRIGFLLPRKTFLKVLGPVIEKSLERGDEVVLLFWPNHATGEKSYQNVDAETLASMFPRAAAITAISPEKLGQASTEAKLDVFVTLEGYYYAKQFDFLNELVHIKNEGTKLVSLSHFFEFMLRPIEALEIFDKSIYLSDYQASLHFNLLGDKNGQLQRRYKDKYAVAGSPIFDLIGKENPQEVKKKFEVPEGKKVILLMSPVLTSATPWRRNVWREPSKVKRSLHSIREKRLGDLKEIWVGKTFKDCVGAIRAFCDRENAYLIVKSRGKQDDPDYLMEAADLLLDGTSDDFYPYFTTYELLSIADVCITVMSMTAPEATIAQVPVVNIYVPHLDFTTDVSQEYLLYIDLLMAKNKRGIMNHPGCVNMIEHNEFPKWFRKVKASAILWDKKERDKYIGEYLGVTEQSSAGKTLEIIDKLIIQEAKPHLAKRTTDHVTQ